MKKLLKSFLLILFFLSFFGGFFQSTQAFSYDFILIPKTTKSGISYEGYFSKIPLAPMKVERGKLDFYKESDGEYISFKGEYDSTTGLLKGVFTSVSVVVSGEGLKNWGYYHYCEFTAEIRKDQTKTILKYYSIYDSDFINHCYAQNVNFEKNKKGKPYEWKPDDIEFEIQPIDHGWEDSGCRFSEFYGTVEVLFPTGYDDNGEPIYGNEDAWEYADPEMPIPYGAKIKLGRNSGMVIATPNLGTIEQRTADKEATIIIAPQKRENRWKIIFGTLYNQIKKIFTDQSFEIEMSQAVAGIKATTFVLIETGKESKLEVLEGKVDFRSKNNNENTIVKAGERVTADNSGLSAKEKFNASTELNKWKMIKDEKREPRSGFIQNNFIYLLIILALAISVGGGLIFLKKIRKK